MVRRFNEPRQQLASYFYVWAVICPIIQLAVHQKRLWNPWLALEYCRLLSAAEFQSGLRLQASNGTKRSRRSHWGLSSGSPSVCSLYFWFTSLDEFPEWCDEGSVAVMATNELKEEES